MGVVTEKVKTYGYNGDADLPRLLVDAVQTFSEDLLSIPEEYRQSAEMEFEPGYEFGESYACVQITYERPETPEEEKLRADDKMRHWNDQLAQALGRVAYCRAQIGALPVGGDVP